MRRRREDRPLLAADDDADDETNAAVDRAFLLLQRDRQLRGTVLLQRSFRRYLNRTYDREDAVRTIQAFMRKYFFQRRRLQDHVSAYSPNDHATPPTIATRAPPPPPPVQQQQYTVVSPGRSNTAGRERTSRSESVYEEEQEEDDDEDEDDIVWGRPSPHKRNEVRRGSDSWLQDRSPRDAGYYHVHDATRSTAPLTVSSNGSTVSTPWQDLPILESSATPSPSTSSRYLPSENSSHMMWAHQRPQQYEVFVWQSMQHGLEMGSCRFTGFPYVVDSTCANMALPGMWRVKDGDYLITINDTSAHDQSLSFHDVDQILESGVRPAILRFRRPRIQEIQARERRERMDRERMMAPAGGRRTTLLNGISGGSASSPAFVSARRDLVRQRERAEMSLCFVIWREEDGPLGIKFVQNRSRLYPEISVIRSVGVAAQSSTLSPRVSVGDELLSVNQWSVREMDFKYVLQVLHCSPRPLVLTFRRGNRYDGDRDERTYEL